MLKKSVTITICAPLALALAFAAYNSLSREKMPLQDLAPHAKTENYTALFQRLNDHDPDEPFSFIVLGDTRSNYATAESILPPR